MFAEQFNYVVMDGIQEEKHRRRARLILKRLSDMHSMSDTQIATVIIDPGKRCSEDIEGKYLCCDRREREGLTKKCETLTRV